MDKWEYSYLIELKTLWEKEKLIVMSNLSFSHNVFKSCLLLKRQNEYLWSKKLSGQNKTFRVLCFVISSRQSMEANLCDWTVHEQLENTLNSLLYN